MNKVLKVLCYAAIIYFAFCFLRLYPIDFFPNRQVDFKINSLYGFPVIAISEFHVSTDIGDFQNRDSLIKGKHNSRDIKAYLSQSYKDEKQNNCTAIVSGPRFYGPVFSIVPNLLSVDCN